MILSQNYLPFSKSNQEIFTTLILKNMPAIKNNLTVEELKNFKYTGKTLEEMDQEDGSAEIFDALVK